MPPIVAAAAITGIATAGGTIASSRMQSSANRRASQASERAAQRAEAFEREQAAREDERLNRVEAEDRRRWEIEQANIARERAEADALRRDEMSRLNQIDQIRHSGKVNLARLAGIEPPPAFQPRQLPPSWTPNASTVADLSRPRPNVSGPMPVRQAQSNAMIAAPGEFDPFARNMVSEMTGGRNGGVMTPPRMPLRRLAQRY